jgi:hypothetical protein
MPPQIIHGRRIAKFSRQFEAFPAQLTTHTNDFSSTISSLTRLYHDFTYRSVATYTTAALFLI